MAKIKGFTKPQAEAFHRKLVGTLVAVIGIVLIFGVGIVIRFADLAVIRHKIGLNSNIERESITVSGAAACLPLRAGAENKDADCVLGIKTDDGDYYAIDGDRSNPLNLYGEIGSKGFEVKGELIEAGPEESYDIIGTVIPE